MLQEGQRPREYCRQSASNLWPSQGEIVDHRMSRLHVDYDRADCHEPLACNCSLQIALGSSFFFFQSASFSSCSWWSKRHALLLRSRGMHFPAFGVKVEVGQFHGEGFRFFIWWPGPCWLNHHPPLPNVQLLARDVAWWGRKKSKIELRESRRNWHSFQFSPRNAKR